MPSDYYMRKIPHDTAGFVAKHWMPAMIEYPLQHRIRFINDMIDRFILLGAYHHSDHNYPVAWVGQKPGKYLTNANAHRMILEIVMIM